MYRTNNYQRMIKLANKLEFSILSNIFTLCIKTSESVQTPKNVPSVRQFPTLCYLNRLVEIRSQSTPVFFCIDGSFPMGNDDLSQKGKNIRSTVHFIDYNLTSSFINLLMHAWLRKQILISSPMIRASIVFDHQAPYSACYHP